MQAKNHTDFCPTIQTRIVGLFFVLFRQFFGHNPCLFGWAEILVILGLHFGRNNDLVASRWNGDGMSAERRSEEMLTGGDNVTSGREKVVGG